MKKQKGFSLIELLIVVAIILIIAAIAIPNLIQAKIRANEARAVGSIKTINTAEVGFASEFPQIGYGSLSALGGAEPCVVGPTSACLIADDLATNGNGAGVAGFMLSVIPGGDSPATTYSSLATPVTPKTTGNNSYCSNETGTIYGGPGSSCTPGGDGIHPL